MGESNGTKIRVILKMIQIHDNLEPAGDDEGEFRFQITVSSRNRGGLREETRLPRKKKFYRISDNPAWNRLVLNEVLFEGEVDDHLEVEILGEELDLLTPNDELTPYRRTFEGDPNTWLGIHKPGDEGDEDPERMNDWWVYLEIEKV
ncbi:MAG: hypothetical protein EA351_15210 [Gemmatimonadales bacterium]|nr:MAG: hypothetical protein EA351_15210 [Gemmatimonadales bacterium]